MGTVASINGTLNSPTGKSILVTGAAGFIGANFVLEWLGLDLSAVVSLDKLTYAGNLDNLASVANDPRHHFVHGDIGDVELVAELLKRHRPDGRRQLRSRVACRPLDPWTRRFRHDQRRGNLPVTGNDPGVLRQPQFAGKSRISIFARLDRRGFRLSRCGRAGIHGDQSLSAEQPLLGDQGGVRSSGPRLVPHVRASGADHQLLEQLRPLSVSGKTHPPDDPSCAGRFAVAGLWRRSAAPGLALCRRSLRRDPRRARARAHRRNLQYRRQQREKRTSRSFTPYAIFSMPSGRARTAARTASKSNS